MFRLVAAAVLATLTASPSAAQQPVKAVSFDGVQAEYNTRLDGHGILHLSGKIRQTAQPFQFKLLPSGHVVGAVGEQSVAFRVKQVQRAAALKAHALELASAAPSPGTAAGAP